MLHFNFWLHQNLPTSYKIWFIFTLSSKFTNCIWNDQIHERTMNSPPCGWEVEYAHRIPACHMRRRKECPDGSASLTVGLRRHPVYPLPGCRLKTLPPFYNLSCQIPTQHLLHMVQHVADRVAPLPVVGIPLLLPSNSYILLHLPPLLPTLTCTRVRVIISSSF